MLKAKVIITVLKALAWIALLGVGIWYLSSSLGGASISYVSLESFLTATGACKDGACDIASSNGCFLCPYIRQLFYTLGRAVEGFWTALLDYIWILLALGFAVFLFVHSLNYVQKKTAETAELDAKEKKFDFKEWFEPVWKQAVRILVAGAFLGALGFGGTQVLRITADVTIRPVMYIGSSLAMAASGVSDAATCNGSAADDRQIAAENDILGPALAPFMCVIGNINIIIMAGAAGGFSLMNYAWMGLGGGLWTWIAGLGLVLMFLIIGFNIFFKILSVIFQLVFLVIFLPLFIAAWAYEKTWPLVKGMFGNAIGMLAKCAVRIIAITLQILVLYAMVAFVADTYFPPPRDGYTAVLPAGVLNRNPGLGAGNQNLAGAPASVMEVFADCEKASKLKDGGVDKDRFKSCFELKRIEVERRHPGAFGFMENGLEFFFMMLGLFLVYYYVIADTIEKKLLGGKEMLGEGDTFEFGKYVKEFGQSLWRFPQQMIDKAGKIWGKS